MRPMVTDWRRSGGTRPVFYPLPLECDLGGRVKYPGDADITIGWAIMTANRW